MYLMHWKVLKTTEAWESNMSVLDALKSIETCV